MDDKRTEDRRAELRRCVAAWRTVVRVAPDDLDAASSLGVALADAGLFEEAVRVLSEVARARPNDARALENLGWAMFTAGAYNSALRQLREAIRLDPGSARAHCHLGLALRAVGRLEEAIQALRRTVVLAPRWSAGYSNLGLALRDLGDLRSAAEALLRGSAAAPCEEIEHALGEVRALRAKVNHCETPAGPMMSGGLAEYPALALLGVLSEQRATGTLMIAAIDAGAIVHLREGNITGAWSPSSRRVGDILSELGALTALDLERALAIQLASPSRSERLGSILARNDLVTIDVLQRALAGQIEESLREIADWTEGSFTFHAELDGAENPERQTHDIEILVETRAALKNLSPTG